jgi:hypothetical protein
MGTFYEDLIKASSPQLYLRLNDTTGTIAVDDSSNSHNGVILKPKSILNVQSSPVVQESNKAVELKTGGNVCVDAESSLVFSQDITLELWMKFINFPDAAGRIKFRSYLNQNPVSEAIYGSAPSTGVWYHLCGTRDSTGVMRLYVNGSQVATANDGGGDFTGRELKLEVTSYGVDPNLVDVVTAEAAIYPSVLNATTIFQHYDDSALLQVIDVASHSIATTELVSTGDTVILNDIVISNAGAIASAQSIGSPSVNAFPQTIVMNLYQTGISFKDSAGVDGQTIGTPTILNKRPQLATPIRMASSILKATASIPSETVDVIYGIPPNPIDYTKTVKEWFMAGPMYPPNRKPIVTFPTVIEASPGGLQTLLDTFPSGMNANVTILLNDGLYEEITVTEKWNIHFVAKHPGQATFTQSYFYGRAAAVSYLTFDADLLTNHTAAAERAIRYLKGNYYFKDIIWDGTTVPVVSDPEVQIHQTHTAINCGMMVRCVKDVLFENCTFQNYINPNTWHVSNISGNGGIENVWAYNCHFKGNMLYGMFLDGAHACGTIYCAFDSWNGGAGTGCKLGGQLRLTNDDFTYVDADGVLYRKNKRNAQYCVSYFDTYGAHQVSAIEYTGETLYVAACTMTAYTPDFIVFDSKYAHVLNNGQRAVYENYGSIIEENYLYDFQHIVKINNDGLTDGGLAYVPDLGYNAKVGNITVQNNRATTAAPHFAATILVSGTVDLSNTSINNYVNGVYY